MTQMRVVYQGALHCEAVHGPSGTVIETDAPKDNHGRGERFSPTDLMGAALGSCMLTIMGIAARAMQVDITGASVEVEKGMAASPRRRIGRFKVVVRVPVTLDERQQEQLRHAALTCPVHESIHPDIERDISFIWG